jgi:membrane protein
MPEIPVAGTAVPAAPVAGTVPVPAAPPERTGAPAARTRQPLAGRLARAVIGVVVVGRRSLAAAWRGRLLGLSAEAGFWQLLSLAPLLLALLGLLGYVQGILGADAVAEVQRVILDGARRVLVPSAVDDVVEPTVTAVLHTGRADFVSLGFLLSLWSGSSAMATFVNTITIAYGQRELRGAVQSRLLALLLYVCALVAGVVLLPLLAVGPSWLATLGRGTPAHRTIVSLVHLGYWPVVALLSVGLLSLLYHVALPQRRPWRAALPGAVLALVIWLVGSFVLRTYLTAVFARTHAFVGLAAPVAVLLFFYITALAVLFGAFLNAEAERYRDERR